MICYSTAMLPPQSCVHDGFSSQQRKLIFNSWPALSPDLNVIENKSKMVGDRVEGQSFENMDFLWQSIGREFHAIPDAVVVLIPKSIKGVSKNRGYRIRY